MVRRDPLPIDILEKLPAASRALEAAPEVVFAYLFGGLARGAPKPLSDVDIAVYLRDASGAGNAKLSLFESITTALGTIEVDLVILNTAPISLVGRIIQGRKLLVDKEPFLRHRFESAKLREFFDFRIREDAFQERRFRNG
jgi:predicted nucleotidyltransferase